MRFMRFSLGAGLCTRTVSAIENINRIGIIVLITVYYEESFPTTKVTAFVLFLGTLRRRDLTTFWCVLEWTAAIL